MHNLPRCTQALLRAKALECISLVGMAVGRDRFRADAHEVMRYIQALQVGAAEGDRSTAVCMRLQLGGPRKG